MGQSRLDARALDAPAVVNAVAAIEVQLANPALTGPQKWACLAQVVERQMTQVPQEQREEFFAAFADMIRFGLKVRA